MYLRQDFEAENRGAFYPYSGSYDALFAADRLVLWQWPGSDREKRVLDKGNITIHSVNATHAYTDDEGREWGYVRIEYKYDDWEWVGRFHEESWVCFSEPTNSRIPSFNPAPAPLRWSPGGNYEWVHRSPNVNAVEQFSLSNFTKVRNYEQDVTFADVPDNAWYRDAVASAYEYGIIEGKGEQRFDPYGEITWAEALAIAARIHAYYRYGEVEGRRQLNLYNREFTGFGIGSRWWGGAEAYCRAEGLVRGQMHNQDDYWSPTPINRARLIHFWVNILEPKDMARRNTVNRLPDVGAGTPHAADITLFFEAGIVGGVDERGTFLPDRNISRAEAATIFMNMINADSRHSGRTYG